jgi:hypothetical protein
MQIVQRRVGRLVEIRMEPPITYAEAVIFAVELQNTVKRMTERFVGVADFSRVHIFPQEVVSTHVDCMRALNAKVERTGVLIASSPTLSLQTARLLRDGSNPKRRAFTKPDELCLWLSEVLTPPEQARLKVFLASP